MEKEEKDGLRYWIDIQNGAHGYASTFARRKGDHAIIERSVAQEWATAMAYFGGMQVRNVQMNDQDPPDLFAWVNDRQISVELTELIEGKHRARAAKDETHYAGQLFLDTQWSAPRLSAKISAILQAKNELYSKRRLSFDLLVIYSGEPWLTYTDTKRWLLDNPVTRVASLKNACLLLDYDPVVCDKSWPLLPLYGELFA